MIRELGHYYFPKAWGYVWVQVTQNPTIQNRKVREENSVHYLAVYPDMLEIAQSSWNSLASLLELRNPLAPANEWGAVRIHCLHPRHCWDILGLQLATSSFWEPLGCEVFPVSDRSENSICLMATPTNSRKELPRLL